MSWSETTRKWKQDEAQNTKQKVTDEVPQVHNKESRFSEVDLHKTN